MVLSRQNHRTRAREYTVCGKMLYVVLKLAAHIKSNITHSTQSVPTDSRVNVHQLVSECRFMTFCMVTDLNILYTDKQTHTETSVTRIFLVQYKIT